MFAYNDCIRSRYHMPMCLGCVFYSNSSVSIWSVRFSLNKLPYFSYGFYSITFAVLSHSPLASYWKNSFHFHIISADRNTKKMFIIKSIRLLLTQKQKHKQPDWLFETDSIRIVIVNLWCMRFTFLFLEK